MSLREEILEGPLAAECAPYVITSEMAKVDGATAAAHDRAIAELLSVGRVRVVSRMISERGILADYADGPIAADVVLSKLESYAGRNASLSSVVGRALKFLGQADGIDIGNPATRMLIDALANADIITADESAKLKALAEAPDPVSPADVSRALRGPWE